MGLPVAVKRGMHNSLFNEQRWMAQAMSSCLKAQLAQQGQALRRIAGMALLAAVGSGWAQTPSSFNPSDAETVAFTEMAFGLQQPWALAFLPNGEYLVAQQEGVMRVVDANGRVGAPILGVPEVAFSGQGGLLDVVLDRNFDVNRLLYFCFAKADASSGGNRTTTALASAKLNERQDRLEQVRTLFQQSPSVRSDQHFGCRIAQAQDDSLFLTLGERFIARDQAQRTTNHLGSIVRLQTDGSAYRDNPFFDKRGGLPETWSWGHRNPLGAVITPDGELWTHEAGLQGGDEINHIRGGGNYGWPIMTYGHHAGARKSSGQGMEAPVHYWRDEIAPSGLTYLSSDRYGPDWQNSFFLGSMAHGALIRLKIDNDKVIEEEWLQVTPGQSVRDVRQGPDGLLYVLIDGEDGRLLRIEPPVLPEVQVPAQASGDDAQTDATTPAAGDAEIHPEPAASAPAVVSPGTPIGAPVAAEPVADFAAAPAVEASSASEPAAQQGAADSEPHPEPSAQ